MRTDKQQAFALRRQGNSYKAIAKELGMSVSTLSNWFKGVDFSEAVKAHLSAEVYEASKRRLLNLNTERGITLAARYEQAETEALRDLEQYGRDPLFVCALAAYWGEGDKVTKGQVRITNTDPKMLSMFYVFLTSICHVQEDRIHGSVFVYPDLDPQKCILFWQQETGVKHFHKAINLPSRHKSRRLPYGVCTIVVSSTYLKRKMTLWIDQLPQLVLNSGAILRP